MTITYLPASARVPTAWRNGGGLTREILAYPPGATMENFAWRVSMAEIQAAGPFSSFPHTHRILTVLTGSLSLTIGTAPPLTLSPASAPLAFAADTPSHGTPLGGPVTDLNVMVRRGRTTATVTRLHSATITLPAPMCLLFALTQGHASAPLAPHDALFFDQEPPHPMPISGDFLLVAITQASKKQGLLF